MSRRNRVTELVCNDFNDLFSLREKAEGILGAADESLWYRGCQDSTYRLIPSLMRDTQHLSGKDHDQLEQDLFFEFQARASELRHRGLSDWEYLFFARHYGLPTRVLDWTETFAVSLYFAVEEQPRRNKTRGRSPAIWIINPYVLNKKALKEREIILPKYLGFDEEKDEYYDFGELLADRDSSWPWNAPAAVYPIQINDRVRAQRGWFTIHGNDRRALEDQVPESLVKILLDPDCVLAARNYLRHAGYNRFAIYPDLENLAGWIRDERLQWADRRRPTP